MLTLFFATLTCLWCVYTKAENRHCDNIIFTGQSSLQPLLSEYETEERKKKYHLYVTNSGPAVIDSEIDFQATVMSEEGEVPEDKLWYFWINDADKTEENYFSTNYQTNISKYMIDPHLILPNQYKMKVCVYKKKDQNYIKLAENHTMFNLTESLNGKVHLSQNITHLNGNVSILATRKTVNFQVTLFDKFYTSPTYIYFWYVDGIFRGTSQDENFLNFTFNSTRTCIVNVTVQTEGLQREKKGHWWHRIHFEDEIEEVNISTPGGMLVAGQSIQVNISYDGSNTIVCWKLKELEKANQTNLTCGHPVKIRKWQVLTWDFPTVGHYRAHVIVKNGISLYEMYTKVMAVYSPDSGSSSTIAVPIVFSMIGLIIIVIATVYLVRLRRKPKVEVANFDFHPFLESTGSKMQKIKGIIYSLFSRDTYSSDHRHASYHQTSAKSYGSTEDTNSIL